MKYVNISINLFTKSFFFRTISTLVLQLLNDRLLTHNYVPDSDRRRSFGLTGRRSVLLRENKTRVKCERWTEYTCHSRLFSSRIVSDGWNLSLNIGTENAPHHWWSWRPILLQFVSGIGYLVSGRTGNVRNHSRPHMFVEFCNRTFQRISSSPFFTSILVPGYVNVSFFLSLHSLSRGFDVTEFIFILFYRNKECPTLYSSLRRFLSSVVLVWQRPRPSWFLFVDRVWRGQEPFK